MLRSQGDMEYMVWKNKSGEHKKHQLQRRVLKPELAKFMKQMDEKQNAELQRRVLEKIDHTVHDLRKRCVTTQASYDGRGIMHSDTNAHRTHTRFLTLLQRHLDVQGIEDACLEDMMDSGDAELIANQAKLSRLLSGTALDHVVNPNAAVKKALPKSLFSSSNLNESDGDAKADAVSALGRKTGGNLADALHPDYVDPAKVLLRRKIDMAAEEGSLTSGSNGAADAWAQYNSLMGVSDQDNVPDFETFRKARDMLQRAESSTDPRDHSLAQMMHNDVAFKKFCKLQQMASKRRHHVGNASGGETADGLAALPPLPDTPLLVKSFSNLPNASRLIGAPEFGEGATSDVLAEPTGFRNSFKQHRSESELDSVSHTDDSSLSSHGLNVTKAKRAHKAHAEGDENSEALDHLSLSMSLGGSSPNQRKQSPGSGKRRQSTMGGRRGTAASSVSADVLQSLQPRLERLWFELQMPMTQKLDFLQKYATVQYAPMLLQAVELWERAAVLFPLFEKVAEILENLRKGQPVSSEELIHGGAGSTSGGAASAQEVGSPKSAKSPPKSALIRKLSTKAGGPPLPNPFKDQLVTCSPPCWIEPPTELTAKVVIINMTADDEAEAAKGGVTSTKEHAMIWLGGVKKKLTEACRILLADADKVSENLRSPSFQPNRLTMFMFCHCSFLSRNLKIRLATRAKILPSRCGARWTANNARRGAEQAAIRGIPDQACWTLPSRALACLLLILRCGVFCSGCFLLLQHALHAARAVLFLLCALCPCCASLWLPCLGPGGVGSATGALFFQKAHGTRGLLREPKPE